MRVSSNKTRESQPAFKGYDGRALRGIIMNTNYRGVADEMLEIAKKEDLTLFFVNKARNGINIKTNSVAETPVHRGCWAQDFWTVLNNNLQCLEEYGETEIVKKFFNLEFNPVQQNVRSKLDVGLYQQLLDFLINLPKCKVNGVEFVKSRNKVTGEIKLTQKSIIDKDIMENGEILSKLRHNTHIPGGNFFAVKGKNGSNELLIGEDELKKYTLPQIKDMFGVEKIHLIPQADYHLDMFMRPLDKKRVLVADDEMMAEMFTEGFNKVAEAVTKPENRAQSELLRKPFMMLGLYANQFKKIISLNPYPKVKDVEKVLNDAGFETIKVPGRVYEVFQNHAIGRQKDYFLTQHLNFMNAVVHKKKDGDLVYITNKSLLDEHVGITEEIEKKIGFSLKQKFLEKIESYVKKEKVYFVSGENNAIAEELLPKYQGGIHCMCAEIPQGAKI